LDCRVYAYAALYALYASGLRLGAHCDNFAQMAGGRRAESKTVIPRQEQSPQATTESVPPALIERMTPEPWVPRRNWF
jgi:phage terminase large subunit GpA-like protein